MLNYSIYSVDKRKEGIDGRAIHPLGASINWIFRILWARKRGEDARVTF